MKRSGGSRVAIISVLVIGIVVFLGVLYSWNNILDIFQPVTTASVSNVPFTIQSGESPIQIANDLQSKGLIRNATAFRWWIRLKGGANLEAGRYDRLNPSMTISQIIDELQKGQPDEVPVLVLEGSRLEEIAADGANANLPKFSKADFLRYTQNASTFPDRSKYPMLFKDVPAGASMEGLLFPDTYYMASNGTALDLIDKMLSEMQTQITTNKIDQYATQHNLSLYQVLTLASIVQREAGASDSPGKIASVYLNRLSSAMSAAAGTNGYMQADPTVQYARDTEEHPTKYWTPLADVGDNIASTSNWNTYTHTGLPPTPICSPGLKVLLASANAPTTNNLFFFTDAHQVTHYEQTYQQFKQDESTFGISQ
ncbi:aminodeoxychorismate lyase [Ktedonobacteria bacterium brp13]|nr:aminodeoxychorismate lyase [Ktedonobacteria bacterium brp13]